MLAKGRIKTEVVSNLGFTLLVEEIAVPYSLASAFLFTDDNRFPVDVVALFSKLIIAKTVATTVEKLSSHEYFHL